MLRALLAGLIVLNALFYGWTQGWMDEVIGIKARGDREPERLARQLHPERVQLLAVSPLTAPSAAMAAMADATVTPENAAPRACLALGPLEGDAALAGALQVLTQAAIAPSLWQDQSNELPAGLQKTWAVATIRLTSKDFLARKEATYKSLKISYEFLAGLPGEQPSLVLSRHASEKAAAAALENFSQRALKGLRVLPLETAVRRHNLVFADADAALQARLRGLTSSAGLTVTPCAAVSPAALPVVVSAPSGLSTPSAPNSPAPAPPAKPR